MGYQPSDDLVLSEGGQTMGAPDMDPSSPSLEGGGQRDGDPAVTGANMGDPQITKGNDVTKGGIVAKKSGSSSGENDKIYSKESDDSDDDDDVMYDKKNKFKSKGGLSVKEEVGVKYGDPVVTKGNNDDVSDDEFNENENYQI